MIILISPAKSLDYLRPIPNFPVVIPQFIKQTEVLLKVAKKLKPENLMELMHISEKIANLNHNRFKQFDPSYKLDDLESEAIPKSKGKVINLRPAIYAFRGDVYQGFDVDSLNKEALHFTNDHLRILSGFYGLLKPLDTLQPYRLEMGIKLQVSKTVDSLYKFWKETLTEELNKQLANEDFLLNLASQEYSDAVDFSKITKPVYSVKFLDQKNGVYKIISFHAKKARGLMARYIVSNKIKNLDKLKKFNLSGYYFDSQEGNILVFKRDEQIA